jgi:hypothetical protein
MTKDRNTPFENKMDINLEQKKALTSSKPETPEIPKEIQELIESEAISMFRDLYDDDLHAMQVDAKRREGIRLCQSFYRKLKEEDKPKGLLWVKASERLPERDGQICVRRLGIGYSAAYTRTCSDGKRVICPMATTQSVWPNWKNTLEWLDEADQSEIASLRSQLEGYKEWAEDYKRLVKDIDVSINGEDGAAKQASLCDLVGPIEKLVSQLIVAREEAADYRKALEEISRGIILAPFQRSMTKAEMEETADRTLFKYPKQ